MTPYRINKLKRFCRDQKIRNETAIECGKLIPSLQDVANLYGFIEELLEHVERQG